MASFLVDSLGFVVVLLGVVPRALLLVLLALLVPSSVVVVSRGSLSLDPVDLVGNRHCHRELLVRCLVRGVGGDFVGQFLGRAFAGVYRDRAGQACLGGQ